MYPGASKVRDSGGSSDIVLRERLFVDAGGAGARTSFELPLPYSRHAPVWSGVYYIMLASTSVQWGQRQPGEQGQNF